MSLDPRLEAVFVDEDAPLYAHKAAGGGQAVVLSAEDPPSKLAIGEGPIAVEKLIYGKQIALHGIPQ